MIEPALVWWFALVIQLLAIPGSLLPVLPGLALLPLGALLWLWAVGWNAAWPPLLLAGLLLLLGCRPVAGPRSGRGWGFWRGCGTFALACLGGQKYFVAIAGEPRGEPLLAGAPPCCGPEAKGLRSSSPVAAPAPG